MFILRLLGSWFLISAMVAFVYDGTKTMGNPEAWVITSLYDYWSSLHPLSLHGVKSAIETNLHPFVWDPILTSLLGLPGWLLLGGIGVLLFYLGRKRTRLNIYTN